MAVIHDIKATYETPWTQVEQDAHTVKWMSMIKGSTEAIHDFFARCMKVRNVSLAHSKPCTESDLRHRFIMGLPAQFTNIQVNADNLPDKWKTASIHQLPTIAETFLSNMNKIRDMHRENRGTHNSSNSVSNNNNSNQSQTQRPANQQQPQQTPQVDQATKNRQDAIYAQIMNDTFRLNDFLAMVPAG